MLRLRRDIHRRLVEHRRRHLARHKPLPDQPVQPELLIGQIPPNRLRRISHIRRPNRLMRILRLTSFFLPAYSFGDAGRYAAPSLPINSRASTIASGDTRVESVRIYVIRPTVPSVPISTPSYKRCATPIVRRTLKSNRLEASCCSLLVVYGACGFRRRSFFSTPRTVHVALPSCAITSSSPPCPAARWQETPPYRPCPHRSPPVPARHRSPPAAQRRSACPFPDPALHRSSDARSV